jgi:DNA-binding transcriptional LysR family regulator
VTVKFRSQNLTSTTVYYFQTVAKLGSIRAAAEELNVAPSAISRQLLKLEEELGVPLLERLPRGMRLTSAGEILIYCAQRSSAELERARAEIAELRGLKRGHIALATVESVASGFLVPLLAKFCGEHSRVTLELMVMGSSRASRAVADGDAEIALTFDVAGAPRLTELAGARLPIGAVMSPKHPLASAKSLKLRDFIEYPVFLSDTSLTMRASLDVAMRRMTIPLTARVVSNSLYLMNRLVAEGTGVAFETRVGVSREIDNGELVYIPLSEPELEPQHLSLKARPESRLAPPAEALAKMLASELSNLGD